jgi:hypothetical protein
MHWIILLVWALLGVVAFYGLYRALNFGYHSSVRRYDSLRDWWDGNQTPSPAPSPSPTAPQPDAEEAYPPGRDEQVRQQVLEREYETHHIGGARVLVETAPGATREEVAVIFDQVKDKVALVNRALDGKVKIEEVKLLTVEPEGPEREFAVMLKVRNLTGGELRLRIPKGQVFEHKQPEKKKQNLAAANEDFIVLKRPDGPDSPPVPITIKALCLNKGFPLPDGHPGNVTIFEVRNKNFINQDQLWDWIAEKRAKPGDSQPLSR